MSSQYLELTELPQEAFVVRERRKTIRARANLRIMIEGEDVQGKPFNELTKSLDFSSSGANFSLQQAVELGSRLILSVALPHSRQIYKTLCQVKRVRRHSKQRGYRVAVELLRAPV